jgi:formylglycine-generating enzyme required for sulfatase activity
MRIPDKHYQSRGKQRFDLIHWFLPDDKTLGFIHVPAGTFWMGSNDLSEDESPLHEIGLPDYWISRYPTTVEQYRVYAEESDAIVLQTTERHPMVHVSWEDALRYCEWLNEKLVSFSKRRKRQSDLFRGLETGKLRVILPSEAEWEKAARGTDGRIYPWGDDFDPQKLNIDETGIGTTSPVGSFPRGASPYGIHDMAGNVWEWTRSIIGEWDDKKGELIHEYNYPYVPNDGREDLRKNSKFMRVIRGGSFAHDRSDTPCAYRGWDQIDLRSDTIGFRVAITLVQD